VKHEMAAIAYNQWRLSVINLGEAHTIFFCYQLLLKHQEEYESYFY
jgi:hypothetical protein